MLSNPAYEPVSPSIKLPVAAIVEPYPAATFPFTVPEPVKVQPVPNEMPFGALIVPPLRVVLTPKLAKAALLSVTLLEPTNKVPQ